MGLLDKWMQAAGDNDLELVIHLYSDNPDLLDERHPSTGRTALQHASAWNAFDVVTFLLDHGAGVLVTDPDGNSILHLAAANAQRSLQLILQHLRHSSNLDQNWTRLLLNQRNRFGYTPLLIAAGEGFAECCEALVSEDGVDSTLPLPEATHPTAIDLALRNGHLQVVEVLRRHTSVD